MLKTAPIPTGATSGSQTRKATINGSLNGLPIDLISIVQHLEQDDSIASVQVPPSAAASNEGGPKVRLKKTHRGDQLGLNFDTGKGTSYALVIRPRQKTSDFVDMANRIHDFIVDGKLCPCNLWRDLQKQKKAA